MATIPVHKTTEGELIAERTYAEVAAIQESLSYYRAECLKQWHDQTLTDAQIKQLRKEAIRILRIALRDMQDKPAKRKTPRVKAGVNENPPHKSPLPK